MKQPASSKCPFWSVQVNLLAKLKNVGIKWSLENLKKPEAVSHLSEQ